AHLFDLLTTAPTGLSPLSLHDALPISPDSSSLRNNTSSISSLTCSTSCRAWSTSSLTSSPGSAAVSRRASRRASGVRNSCETARSEEHTSELQSRGHLVCRLLLEKKKE